MPPIAVETWVDGAREVEELDSSIVEVPIEEDEADKVTEELDSNDVEM